MSDPPFHLRGQIVTQVDRDTVREETAQSMRDEIEADRVDFDERTLRLKALRLARDAKLKSQQLAGRIRLRAGPRRS